MASFESHKPTFIVIARQWQVPLRLQRLESIRSLAQCIEHIAALVVLASVCWAWLYQDHIFEPPILTNMKCHKQHKDGASIKQHFHDGNTMPFPNSHLSRQSLFFYNKFLKHAKACLYASNRWLLHAQSDGAMQPLAGTHAQGKNRLQQIRLIHLYAMQLIYRTQHRRRNILQT